MLNKEQPPIDFKSHHSLLVFLLSTIWILLSIGAIEFFQWKIVTGLLIHSGIIIITLGYTVMVTRTLKISYLLSTLSSKGVTWQYYLIAIVLALVIWLADFWLQLFFFLNDGKKDSLLLQTEIQSFGIFSIIVASCLLAPIAEELLFRSILLKGLLNTLSPFSAILISSLLFATIHFSPQDFISLFIAASGYSILTIRAQSIQPALFAHLINNSMTLYYLSTL